MPYRQPSVVISSVKKNKTYKKIVYEKTLKWSYTEWDDWNRGTELYDQLNDPLEYINLSARKEYEYIKEQMQKLIIKP